MGAFFNNQAFLSQLQGQGGALPSPSGIGGIFSNPAFLAQFQTPTPTPMPRVTQPNPLQRAFLSMGTGLGQEDQHNQNYSGDLRRRFIGMNPFRL